MISKQMMIGGLVVGAVVVVGGGYFLFSPKNTPSNTQNESPATEQTGKKMAFTDFVKQGGSYQCTVNQNVGGVETKGTTYLSNGMMKGEFTTNTQGMNITSNVIFRDGYSYTWSSALPTMGFKMKVDANMQPTGTGSASGQYNFNADQIGDYDCQAWIADQSKFTIPATVTFQEINK